MDRTITYLKYMDLILKSYSKVGSQPDLTDLDIEKLEISLGLSNHFEFKLTPIELQACYTKLIDDKYLFKPNTIMINQLL